jgi:hypothetical protein
MRTLCRLILGIAVLVAAAGVVYAQQPDSQPPPSPVPETQVTPAPAPLPPEIVPPAAETTKVPVLQLVPVAPEPATKAKPVKKASSPPARKQVQATATRKPTGQPAPPESSPQSKEAAAAASVSVSADSTSPPPPAAPNVPVGAVNPNTSKQAPPAVDPAVQAEVDKKLADAARKGAGGWIVLALGGLALIGLAVYFVRSRKGEERLPTMFEEGLPGPAIVAPVRSEPLR